MISTTTLAREFPWRWIMWWLLLPNLTFMLMWAIGGPPMTPIIARGAIASLVIAQLPWRTPKRIALAGMMLWALYYYVCAMFNIPPSQLDFVLPFLREVRPLRSPEYLIAAILFAASLFLVLRFAPRVPRFPSILSYGFAMLAIMGLLAADVAATRSTRGSYRAAPPEGTQFTSAVQQAGLEMPREGNRHLVIVVVEALGVPSGHPEQQLFNDAWNRVHWSARYQVRSGRIPFFGSTTSGELRELCGRFDSYTRAAAFGTECLPARYRQQGYQTSAIHGFTPALFNRDDWYGDIGFSDAMFRDDLMDRGLSHCIGVFAGACDREVPALIAARLKSATRPQLVYFLTLNTHLPIMADEGLRTKECELGGSEWSALYPQVCRLYLMHKHLADEIDRMAMDPDLPPTDFLIVGDHLPPFFDRRDRSRFDGGSVPWVLLRSRAPGRESPA